MAGTFKTVSRCNFFRLIFIIVVFIQSGCTKDKSNENNIIDFYFPNRQHDVKIDENEIRITIYDNQLVNNIAPIITISDKATISPASRLVQDFSKDVTYIVTAENGDLKYYTVKLSKSNENNIIGFYFPNRQHGVKIDENEILITMYDDISLLPLNHLAPTVIVSDKATVSPESSIAQDFTKDVVYKVVAENGEVKSYVVKVKAGYSDNELISFTIPNQSFELRKDGNNIYVETYKYVNVSNLTPVIEISKAATIEPSSGTVTDFTNPVIYTVTAQDGSVTTYTVTVSQSLSRKNDIESFRLTGTEQIFEREGDNLFVYVPYETDITSISTEIIVSDKATVNPVSGSIMDFTSPQMYTVKASDGSSKNYLVTVKKSPWRLENAISPFYIRDGAGLVEFKGKLWLLGGWKHGPTCSEVWNSDDGIHWEYVMDAPWEGRHGAGFVVFNDAMWVVSGDGIADVWKSEDGINWNLVTDNPPWGRRYAPYIAVYRDKLWLMGGLNWWADDGTFEHDKGVKAYNDVWSSSDGENWVLENSNAAWAQRGLIHGYVVLNNEMYIMGGGIKGYADQPLSSKTIAEYNDVWKTKDGVTWTRVLQHAPWKARTHFSVTTYNGHIIVNDGSVGEQSELSNETWYSSNGMDWKQVKFPFWINTHASSIGVYNNKLWLVAGYGLDKIWSLDINDL